MLITSCIKYEIKLHLLHKFIYFSILILDVISIFRMKWKVCEVYGKHQKTYNLSYQIIFSHHATVV